MEGGCDIDLQFYPDGRILLVAPYAVFEYIDDTKERHKAFLLFEDGELDLTFDAGVGDPCYSCSGQLFRFDEGLRASAYLVP
jgi:hypothetical protein